MLEKAREREGTIRSLVAPNWLGPAAGLRATHNQARYFWSPLAPRAQVPAVTVGPLDFGPLHSKKPRSDYNVIY